MLHNAPDFGEQVYQLKFTLHLVLVFRLDYPNDSDRKVVLICGLLDSLKSSLKVIESSGWSVPHDDFDGYVKGCYDLCRRDRLVSEYQNCMHCDVSR